MIKTATREARHGGRLPEIHPLLQEDWEGARAEEDEDIRR